MFASAPIILYKDGKVLLQLRDGNTSFCPHNWGFFGGKIEEGETPLDCVKRECLEELSYELYDPRFIGSFASKDFKEYVFIEEYDGSDLILGEGADMGWFSLEDVRNCDHICSKKEILEKVFEIISD